MKAIRHGLVTGITRFAALALALTAAIGCGSEPVIGGKLEQQQQQLTKSAASQSQSGVYTQIPDAPPGTDPEQIAQVEREQRGQ